MRLRMQHIESAYYIINRNILQSISEMGIKPSQRKAHLTVASGLLYQKPED